MPKTVNLAIKLIWISLMVSVLLSIAQKFLGDISLSDLLIVLMINGLMCLIPYTLAQRSNMSRHVFLALFVLAVFFLLAAGEEIEVTLLDKVDLLINIPLNIYAIYLLFFNQPAQQWFKGET